MPKDTCPINGNSECNYVERVLVPRADCARVMAQQDFKCVCWEDHESDPEMCYILVSDELRNS